jgi:hypothetical protein
LERRQTIINAALCELVGLALMIFVNRLVPNPVDLIVTGVGFLLLLLGPFLVIFQGRDT